MGKFAVISGFLGSGKTTTMMALTKYNETRQKTAMISNDLGGAGLADHRFAALSGCNASELTGACICYQTENLVKRLDSLFREENCQLVLSDIPGFGVGALEEVYHKLENNYPGQFPLAPFTVLVEPQTVSRLQEKSDDLALIQHFQLQEADLIVLNKCDLLDKTAQKAAISWLQGAYPRATVLAVSARTGEGLESLSQALLTGHASLCHPDIDYGGFARAVAGMSEYYLQYYATVCCNDFDGNRYLLDLGEAIQKDLDVPHLKLLAWEPEGDYGKADLLGRNRPVELTKPFSAPCTELAVVLNASALSGREDFDRVVTGAVEKISEKYQLTLMIFKKQCFGVTEE